jgi:hypothetical protein
MTAPERRTNLALLGAFVVALATGAGSFATGSSTGRWVVSAHGVAGLAVIVLAPWKTRIVRRGLARRRPGLAASLALAVLVVVAVVAGLAHSSGALESIGPLSMMQLHVGAAIAALPLVAWHVVARPARPRVTDLSRRMLLRTGIFVGGATVAYAATEGLIHATGLPGEDRRFTGSFETGSFEPGAMPVTQWLNDTVPAIDADRWRLVVATPEGERSLAGGDLVPEGSVQASLDCTGGWFAEQLWEGTWLSHLVGDVPPDRSVLIRSVTGYQRRFPGADVGELMLATRVAGEQLSAGHGFPLRLVAPGRRGFWWVKWVERVQVDETPWWWQPPFPIS